MSSFSKRLATTIAKKGGHVKVICNQETGNIPADVEWMKWLSYESVFERKRMEYFDSKKVSELSYEELEEASKYSKNRAFAKLFKIYGTDKCSEEDYLKVYDYMAHESIENLMLSKLTFEELQYAKQEITRLGKVSKEQLSTKISEEQQPEKYEQLSMVDSFILHFISKMNFARNMDDFNRQLENKIAQNNNMAYKSLYYASNPCAKK